ncbi:MAG: fluoride efflux transporter CrcB [Beijerinckiaceae bacterium]|jgi:CrcB protein
MLTYLWIAIGGALGSMARFAVASVVDSGVRDTFPLGTVLVNISGCLVIGFFFALTVPTGRFNVPLEVRHFFMVGICGGYTTFSSFGLQTLVLARTGDVLRAGANVVVSVVVCLIAVWVGSLVGGALSGASGD